MESKRQSAKLGLDAGKVLRMDSFLFIGFRVDVKPKGKSFWDLYEQVTDCDDGVVKGKTWGAWSHPDREHDSYLYLKAEYWYKCPFGHLWMWEEMNRRTFDMPANFIEVCRDMQESAGWQDLERIYGRDNMIIQWGIFKGLG